MAIADVLASHRSGDKLRTAARTLVVAVRQASCLWVLWLAVRPGTSAT
ncbi:hypothetical protein ACFWCB_11350 [Streptomyces sp. NPDC060048]